MCFAEQDINDSEAEKCTLLASYHFIKYLLFWIHCKHMITEVLLSRSQIPDLISLLANPTKGKLFATIQ